MPADIDRLNIEVAADVSSATDSLDELAGSLRDVKRATDGGAGLPGLKDRLKELNKEFDSLDLSEVAKQFREVNLLFASFRDADEGTEAINKFRESMDALKGVSAVIAELKDSLAAIDMTQLKASMQGFVDAMTSISDGQTDKLVQVSESLARVSETINGAKSSTQSMNQEFSRSKEAVSAFGDVFSGSFGKSYKKVATLTSYLRKVSAQVAEAGESSRSSAGRMTTAFGEASKALKGTNEMTGEFSNSAASMRASALSATSGLRSVGTASGITSISIGGLTASVKALLSSIPVVGWVALGVGVALSALTKIVSALANTIKSLASTFAVAVKKLSAFVGKIKDAISRFFDFNKMSRSTSDSMGLLTRAWNKFWNAVESKVFRGMANSLFNSVTDGLKELAAEFSSFNSVMSQGVSSVQQLKNAFAASLAPAIAGLIPIVTQVINVFVRLFEVVGAFFSLLFGTPFYTAKDVAMDYAGALGEVGGAAKKAAKEMNRLPFDELNTISQDNASTGGGGGGGGGINDWFEESPIPDWITDLFGDGAYDFGWNLGELLYNWLDEIDWGLLNAKAAQLGKDFGNLVNGFVDFYLQAEDPGIIGRSVAKLLNSGLILAESFLDTTNFKNLGTFFGLNIQASIEAFEWGQLGRVIGKGIGAAIITTYNAIKEIGFWKLGLGIGEAIVQAVGAIPWATLANTIVLGIQSAVDLLDSLILKLKTANLGQRLGTLFMNVVRDTPWEEVGRSLGEAFEWALGELANFISTLNGADIVAAIRSFLEGFNWDGIKEQLSEIWEGVWRVLGEIGFEIGGNSTLNILDSVKELLEEIPPAIGWISDAVGDIKWEEVFQKVGDVIREIPDIIDGVRRAIKTVTDVVKILWTMFKNNPIVKPFRIAIEILDAFGVSIGDVTGFVGGLMGALVECGEQLIAGLAEGITSAFSNFWGFIKDTITIHFVDPFKVFFGIHSPSTLFAEFGGYLIEGLKQGIADTIESVVAVFTGLWDSIKITAQSAVDGVTEIWGVIAEWFSTTVIEPVREAFEVALTAVKDFFADRWADIQGIWEIVSNWFTTTVIDPVRNAFDTALTKIKEFFSDRWNDIMGIWSAVEGWFQNTVIDPVKNIFDTVTTKIKGFFSETWEKVQSVWRGAKTWFSTYVTGPIKNIFTTLANGVLSTFEGLGNGLISAFESIINFFIRALNSLSIDVPATPWTDSFTIGFALDEIELKRISLPRFKTGLDFVPGDYFPAFLDYGEAVLPYGDANLWRSVGGGEGVRALASGRINTGAIDTASLRAAPATYTQPLAYTISDGGSRDYRDDNLVKAISSAIRENSDILEQKPVTLSVGNRVIFESAEMGRKERGLVIGGDFAFAK